jgi:hypothetical protein
LLLLQGSLERGFFFVLDYELSLSLPFGAYIGAFTDGTSAALVLYDKMGIHNTNIFLYDTVYRDGTRSPTINE